MTISILIILIGVVFVYFLSAILSCLRDLNRGLSAIHHGLTNLNEAVGRIEELGNKRATVEHLDDQLEAERRRRLEG